MQMIKKMNIRLLPNKDAGDWYLKAEMNKNENGRLVILDNTGNLISRQVLTFVKGENQIPIPKNSISNAHIHVFILYLGNEVVFSQLIMK
jgi:hypothetical protein